MPWAFAGLTVSVAIAIPMTATRVERLHTHFFVLFIHDLISFLLFRPSLTPRFEKSFLAVHWCTVRNLTRGYAESSWEVEAVPSPPRQGGEAADDADLREKIVSASR